MRIIGLATLYLIGNQRRRVDPQRIAGVFRQELGRGLLRVHRVLRPISFLGRLRTAPRMERTRAPFVDHGHDALHLLPRFVQGREHARLLTCVLRRVTRLNRVPRRRTLRQLGRLTTRAALPRRHRRGSHLFVNLNGRAYNALSSVP